MFAMKCAFFFCLAVGATASAAVIESDICVYGGTSGGVVAAVQAARMGKSVVIAEPGRHLGGMTSGGLSAVDIGDPRSVGGIAREYFTRLAATAGVTLAWDKPFESQGGGPATGGAYAIEPHKAEKLFDDMAQEAGVKVLRLARLTEARKEGARITELVMESGDVVRAKMFIDCTYEGDLMAKAGVSYTLMREGNAKYGETYNGIHYSPRFEPRRGFEQPGPTGRLKTGQGVWDRDFPLDPYVVKGDPTSGVLPFVNEGDPGTPGDPAPGVQAYCFRLCLTTNPANMIPITPPPDYDARRYEIVARFIEACLANGDDMDLRWFSKHDPLPNDKWDFNTATFGGNLPGASWAWPEATYAEREKIAKQHEDYHRGLLHFLATDPRVPEKVRRDMRRFGLPKDEFTDNGGWPHQIYVREGRRMISDLVMTEHHTFGREVAAKSVGLGSYGTDTHEIRRIVRDGVVTREGKTAGGRDGAPPYPIGYDAIVPKKGECANLLVTFALSASHTAFSSIRMEPVFMCTSQSAATAAAQAIDDGAPLQAVDYSTLKARLEQDGQVLEWRPGRPGRPVPSRKMAGILMDDDHGELVGSWVVSTKQAVFVGKGYRHDNNQDKGQSIARFTAKIPASGEYEVRVIYTATSNRATNVPVTIEAADGTKSVTLNEREACVEKAVPRALGQFRFEKGKDAVVTLSNTGTDGYVVVDAVQWVPAEIAAAERAGKVDSGFRELEIAKTAAAASDPRAAAVAVSPLTKEVPGKQVAAPSSEPVMLARDIKKPAEHYDLVVVGGTASGVACAVRAVREGCTVLLVQHNRHIGGMLANGLMQWDALYGGPRAPLMTELLGNIEKDAIARYGKDSMGHQTIKYTHEHYPIGWVESHVMERECHRLIVAEKNLSLLLEHYPTAVERDGAMIKSVTFNDGSKVAAAMFVDATYEGDLMALAKVPYRVGREARDEYGEPHAGKAFTNIDHGTPQSVAAEGLNIRSYGSKQGSVDPTSPFTADGNSQAYNYRFCVTKDPDNRQMLTEPPPGYDREEYVNYDRKSIATNAGPNLKSHMNSPILPGENAAYPEASWQERQKIIDRHKNFGLGLIWFLQNDESTKSKWAEYRQWGLAKDEFPDNGHIPYEMYVREARRLVGRYVLTEHDGSMAQAYGRAPVHEDSVAVTDWYMDSHSCTTDSRPGYRYDGKLILTEESRPMQVPYRAMLPKEVDNLLVPVCLSSTHIAWGALRLEPVWMQTGEAAGWAAALAKKEKTTPGKLDPEVLLRTLVQKRHLVSFFNDFKVDAADPRIPAAEYFATKGFFASYDARLDEPLNEAVAAVWKKGVDQLKKGTLNGAALATEVRRAEAKNAPATDETRGVVLLRYWNQINQP